MNKARLLAIPVFLFGCSDQNVGRYQIVALDSGAVFRLDTATGEVAGCVAQAVGRRGIEVTCPDGKAGEPAETAIEVPAESPVRDEAANAPPGGYTIITDEKRAEELRDEIRGRAERAGGLPPGDEQDAELVLLEIAYEELQRLEQQIARREAQAQRRRERFMAPPSQPPSDAIPDA